MATLAQIRRRCLQRADLEYEQSATDAQRFVTDDEVDELINTKYKRLYGLLVRHGIHVGESVATIEADGSESYTLPSDLFAVMTVWRDDGGRWYRLGRHGQRVRPNSTLVGPALTYRVVGTALEFIPTPDSGDYEVKYVPVPGTLTADDDEMDGVLGWEEYVVIAVAIELKQKEDVNADKLKADLVRIEREIADEAQAAEMTEGVVVADVRYGRDDLTGGLPGDYTRGMGYRGPLW